MQPKEPDDWERLLQDIKAVAELSVLYFQASQNHQEACKELPLAATTRGSESCCVDADSPVRSPLTDPNSLTNTACFPPCMLDSGCRAPCMHCKREASKLSLKGHLRWRSPALEATMQRAETVLGMALGCFKGRGVRICVCLCVTWWCMSAALVFAFCGWTTS